MKGAAGFLIALIVAGCSTPRAALNPNPDNPSVIYAIPQSQAFAIARGAIQSAAQRCGADSVHVDTISRGDGLRGYEADFNSWFYRFYMPRRLYVVPAAGIGASGEPVEGFRFEITYWYYRGLRTVYPRLPGGGCERTLIGALHVALEATGTATSVTSLATRPYGQVLARSSASH